MSAMRTGSLWVGIAVIAGVNLALWCLAYHAKGGDRLPPEGLKRGARGSKASDRSTG